MEPGLRPKQPGLQQDLGMQLHFGLQQYTGQQQQLGLQHEVNGMEPQFRDLEILMEPGLPQQQPGLQQDLGMQWQPELQRQLAQQLKEIDDEFSLERHVQRQGFPQQPQPQMQDQGALQEQADFNQW